MYTANLFGTYPTIHNATPKHLPVNQDTVNYLHDEVVSLTIKAKKLSIALGVVIIAFVAQAILHF
jgi:hypothetical protein